MTPAQKIVAERILTTALTDRRIANKAVTDRFSLDRIPVGVKADYEIRVAEVEALEALLALVTG